METLLYGLLAVGATAFGTFIITNRFGAQARLRRAEFIRTYKWPRGLYKALLKTRPGLSRKEIALTSRALRQFFIAYLMSGKRFVSMPSQAADDLWHAFILYTREYEQFCKKAFGGPLHHAPASVLGADRKGNEGLRRVWWYTCKYENIDPYHPSRLPLLFALDSKLKLADGFHYHPDCEPLRALRRNQGDTGVLPYCGGDFSSTSYDGTTAGLGDSTTSDTSPGSDTGSSDSSSSSSDAGSSCGGGGCGGGGGD